MARENTENKMIKEFMILKEMGKKMVASIIGFPSKNPLESVEEGVRSVQNLLLLLYGG